MMEGGSEAASCGEMLEFDHERRDLSLMDINLKPAATEQKKNM